jgi:small subunit ribosomal protein S4
LTGETLLSLLESRLDNVVYRLGFADSRAQARQLVRHGHFTVNGHKTDIPSFLVNPGDMVQVQSVSRSNAYFKDRLQLLEGANPPGWLRLDVANLSGNVVSTPNREEIAVPLREQLIVEYYSR